MQKVAPLTAKNNVLFVAGDLNFLTVPSLFRQSQLLMQNQKACAVDLSGVVSSNSAGLALLVEWIKWAKKGNIVIRFQHIPQHLLFLAEAAGMAALLKVYEAEGSNHE